MSGFRWSLKFVQVLGSCCIRSKKVVKQVNSCIIEQSLDDLFEVWEGSQCKIYFKKRT